MSDEHSCITGGTIDIRDVNGETMMRFLRLCSDDGGGVYYGGSVHDFFRQFVPGPHVWYILEGMLNLIAAMANDPGNDAKRAAYEISGQGRQVMIGREMRSDLLAAILRCDEQKIIDHFGRVVRAVKPDG